MVFRELLLSYKEDTGWQCGKCSGVVAKYFLVDNFNALILILSKNLFLDNDASFCAFISSGQTTTYV